MKSSNPGIPPRIPSDASVSGVPVVDATAFGGDKEAYLRYLENMNRIHRVLGGDRQAGSVLQACVEELLDIFAADRCMLAFPCEPDVQAVKFPFLAQRPDSRIPAFEKSHSSMSEDLRRMIAAVLEREEPLALGPSDPSSLGTDYMVRFSIRSRLTIAIRPRIGKAWNLTLHQCLRDREWTGAEKILFRDIAARIKSSLESLLLERELTESAELHHLMTEVMPQLVWTTDTEGRVDYVNRRWMEYTGQTWEHSLGTGGKDALHPDDVALCLERWKEAISTGSFYEVELRYRRHDGVYLWHLTRAYPFRDAEAGVRRWIGTCTDISEAKAAQEAAARTREERDVILEGVGEGISAQDATGRLIYANRAFARFSGYGDAESLLAAPLEERMARFSMFDEAGDPVDFGKAPGRLALQEGMQAAMVMRVVARQDGGECWLNIKSTPVRDKDGNVVMAINFVQDVTAAVNAREELIRSREQLATILSGTADAIIAQDRDGRLIYANTAAGRLFGLPSAEALMEAAAAAFEAGTDPGLSFTDEAGRPVPIENIPNRVARNGMEVGPVLLRFRQAGKADNGRERWVISQAKPILDKDGKVSMIISLTQDITELREKEEVLRRLQKMESLGKLAGGIAHDFNNLLVSINGYSEMGLQLAEGHPELEEFLREILKSGRRAASLTQQLLAYSRKQVIRPKPILLNDIVSDMEKMLVRLIGEDISLKTILADPLPAIEADQSQVEQVVMNLVLNARDAMPGGGTLTLETGIENLDEVYVARHPDARTGRHVCLAVTDTGAGMEPAVLERVFEPFFTTKEMGAGPKGRTGTGLGLASVYGIVNQCGGHIQVGTKVGEGSTFRVLIPAMKVGADAAVRAPGPPQAWTPTSECILLVEDEDSVRTFTRMVLERKGYRVDAARDGFEALELAARPGQEFNLLLTDVVMPHMRGTDLVDRIRAIHPGIKVLLMSGYPDSSVLSPDPTAGTAGFLQKPFRVEQLLAEVGRILEGAAAVPP